MNIYDNFANLKVSKKLFIGFSLMLLVIFTVFISALIGFNRIKDQADKNVLTVEMNTTLTTARLSRTNYQFTSDPKYLEQNSQSMRKLADIVNELKQFSWNNAEAESLDRTDRAVRNYQADAIPFIASLKMKAQAETLLNSKGLYDKSITADQLGRNAELSGPLALKATQLGFMLNNIDSMLSYYKTTPNEAQQLALLALLKQGIENAQQLLSDLPPNLHQPWLPNGVKEMQGFSEQLDDYQAAWEQQNTASTQLTGRANELTEAIDTLFDLQKVMAEKVIGIAKMVMMVVSMAGVLLGMLLAYLITRSITQPLNETLRVAKNIARSDLTSTLVSRHHDEPGLLMQAVSTMNENLKEIILNVRDGVGSVARSSAEIAAGCIALSSRTDQQSAAVVETAASMEELTSTVEQNAANANYARQLAENASLKAVEGSRVSRQVIDTMKNVRSSSQRISEIIEVINGIAFQTNILALNAAVEAAHAGEQGKGFAVVAVEVRNLAQRSSQSSKQIEALIKESAGFVDSGYALVEDAGVAMDAIVTSVGQVRDIMSDIALATDEQSKGISQIALAMVEMDTTTQQNAALVEESSAAASSLEEQAVQLEKVVSVFKLTEGETIKPPVVSSKVYTPLSAKSAVTGAQDDWASF